jgi:hypothetical protein
LRPSKLASRLFEDDAVVAEDLLTDLIEGHSNFGLGG